MSFETRALAERSLLASGWLPQRDGSFRHGFTVARIVEGPEGADIRFEYDFSRSASGGVRGYRGGRGSQNRPIPHLGGATSPPAVADGSTPSAIGAGRE